MKYLFGLLLALALGTPTLVVADDLARFFPADSYFYLGSNGWNGIKDSFDDSPAGEVWAHPRFDGLRNDVESFPAFVYELLGGIQQQADAESNPLSLPMKMILSSNGPQMLFNSMRYGVALGVPAFDIDPVDPKLQGYLIIQAGDDAPTVRSQFGGYLMKSVLNDPHSEELGGIRWAVSTLDTDPSFDIWWGEHEGRVVFAIGEQSVKTYFSMCDGNRTSLAASTGYKSGMQRCIGDSRVNASLHLDFPAILDQVLGLMDEFGATLPPEAEAVIDEVSRLGAIHIACGEVGDESITYTSGVSFPFQGSVGGGQPITSEMFALLPARPFLFWSASYDGKAIYQQILESIEALFPPEQTWKVEQGRKTIEALTGVPFDDIVASLGDRVTVFEESSARGLIPGFVISIAGADAKLMNEIIRTKLPLISMMTGSMRTRLTLGSLEVPLRGSGQLIRYMQSSARDNPVVLAWTEIDGEMLFAMHPTVLEQLIHRIETRSGDSDRFQIPALVSGACQIPDGAANGAGLIDLGALLEWSWPTIVPALQKMLSRKGGQFDAASIPSAHLFESWKVEARMWIDESGFRATKTSPMPMGPEFLGGMILGMTAAFMEVEQQEQQPEAPDSNPSPETKETEPPVTAEPVKAEPLR